MRTLTAILPLAVAACAAQSEPFAIRCTGESRGTAVAGDGVETGVASGTWMIDPKRKTLTEIGPDGRTGTSFCPPSRPGGRCDVRVSAAAVQADWVRHQRFSNGHRSRTLRQFRYDRRAKTAFAAQYISGTGSPDRYTVRQMSCLPTPLPLLDTAE